MCRARHRPGAPLIALGLGHLAPRRVGLLGGSFNPAHRGHLQISREALRRLDLDEVWWLVSPQNPLKAKRGMATFARRLGAARMLANDRRIRVLDLEERLGTRYTIDTLGELERRFPRQHFVWLMGADILTELPRWKDWAEIFLRVPIAAFARPTYCQKALAGRAAHRFARARIGPAAARHLAGMTPPAWAFLSMPLDPSSGTAIRTTRRRSSSVIKRKR